jgi:hypothetical protein
MLTLDHRTWLIVDGKGAGYEKEKHLAQNAQCQMTKAQGSSRRHLRLWRRSQMPSANQPSRPNKGGRFAFARRCSALLAFLGEESAGLSAFRLARSQAFRKSRRYALERFSTLKNASLRGDPADWYALERFFSSCREGATGAPHR